MEIAHVGGAVVLRHNGRSWRSAQFGLRATSADRIARLGAVAQAATALEQGEALGSAERFLALARADGCEEVLWSATSADALASWASEARGYQGALVTALREAMRHD